MIYNDDDDAYVEHHEREADHLRHHDEGEAENMTTEQRQQKADKHIQRAQDRRYNP